MLYKTCQAGVCPKHLLEKNVDVSIPFPHRVQTCPETDFASLSGDCSCVGFMTDHKTYHIHGRFAQLRATSFEPGILRFMFLRLSLTSPWLLKKNLHFFGSGYLWKEGTVIAVNQQPARY